MLHHHRVRREGVIAPELNLLPVETVGYSLSGFYLLTNPARLNLPGTKVPAGIALKVTESHKLHHHVKVITHGEVQQMLGAFILKYSQHVHVSYKRPITGVAP